MSTRSYGACLDLQLRSFDACTWAKRRLIDRITGRGEWATRTWPHADTFYVGTLKGVGRVYQQTAIDTYAKVAFAKLYDRKTPLTAADLMNDRVVTFFEEDEIVVSVGAPSA